jgi:hypothetical protein
MLDRRDIRNIYSKLSKKIKNFLLSEQSREFLIFLFFFIVAAGFWLIQTLNKDYETELNLPVQIEGVPDSVVLTSPPPAELYLRVRDKGTALVNYMLGKGVYPLILNFADYKGKNSRVTLPINLFEKEIQNRLSASTTILSVHPDTIDYIFSRGKAKRVPVCLQGQVSAGQQYYVSDTLFNHDSVRVYAPANILDTIRAAYTRPLIANNISDTTRRRIALQQVKGAKFVPNEVEVTLPVDIYTEKSVEVALTGVDFPPNMVLRAFPSKVQVRFHVGLKHFRSIQAKDFVIHVSYNELLKLGSDKYTVKLTSHPAEVSRIRITPPQVDFLIEQESPSNGN